MSLQSQIDILALGLCDLYKKINDNNTTREGGNNCNCSYELNINSIRSVKCDPTIFSGDTYTDTDYLIAINTNFDILYNTVLTTSEIFNLALNTHNTECNYCVNDGTTFSNYTNITSITSIYDFFETHSAEFTSISWIDEKTGLGKYFNFEHNYNISLNIPVAGINNYIINTIPNYNTKFSTLQNIAYDYKDNNEKYYGKNIIHRYGANLLVSIDDDKLTINNEIVTPIIHFTELTHSSDNENIEFEKLNPNIITPTTRSKTKITQIQTNNVFIDLIDGNNSIVHNNKYLFNGNDLILDPITFERNNITLMVNLNSNNVVVHYNNSDIKYSYVNKFENNQIVIENINNVSGSIRKIYFYGTNGESYDITYYKNNEIKYIYKKNDPDIEIIIK